MSWDTTMYFFFHFLLLLWILKFVSMCKCGFYLHEVVCPLHLGHEVLHGLLSDHWVIGRSGSDVVHSNGWFCSQQGLGLVLEGVHHLSKTQTHVTGTQKVHVNTTCLEICIVPLRTVVME